MKSAIRWDIFCKVIDNFGDIGVCWRLAADLTSRGHLVRLWVDDAAALSWMAPGALQGNWPQVQVLAWEQARDAALLARLAPADVWIEGFGCEIAAEYLEHRFNRTRSSATLVNTQPIWVNLEYLSAESFAARAHGLPSPVTHGPATGHTRFFFYPGFSLQTGGLLRERDLVTRQAGFDRTAWLASQGIHWRGERLVSLFCYEPPALADLLVHLRQDPTPARLLVTHGRATAAVRRLQGDPDRDPQTAVAGKPESLPVTFLPALSQTDFDHLLWACDLNFVRGEDSLARAIWAGKPFVWQIYAQHDNAHHVKLQALLDTLAAPDSWRLFHLRWNGIVKESLPQPEFEAWNHAVLHAKDRLTQQSDLTTRLLKFIETEQSARHSRPEKR